MRYVATTDSRLPDGRFIPKGRAYDFPQLEAEAPKTLSQMAKASFQKDEQRREEMSGKAAGPKSGGGSQRSTK